MSDKSDCRPLNRSRFSGPARLWLLILASGCLLLTSGCATRREIVGFQEDTRAIRTDIDSLQRQQRLMAGQISTIEQEVRDLRATSEFGSSTLEDKVESLAARLDDILGRMNRTMAPLEDFIRRQQQSDTAGAGSSIGIDYFDAAQRDLALGNYDLAEDAFLQFLQANPRSDLADDARYGLAETYYARKKYNQAADEYRRVVDMNPMGGKAPAAMLKLGLSQRALGDLRDARRTWEDLIKMFPRSEEAKVAQQRLTEIRR